MSTCRSSAWLRGWLYRNISATLTPGCLSMHSCDRSHDTSLTSTAASKPFILHQATPVDRVAAYEQVRAVLPRRHGARVPYSKYAFSLSTMTFTACHAPGRSDSSTDRAEAPPRAGPGREPCPRALSRASPQHLLSMVRSDTTVARGAARLDPDHERKRVVEGASAARRAPCKAASGRPITRFGLCARCCRRRARARAWVAPARCRAGKKPVNGMPGVPMSGTPLPLPAPGPCPRRAYGSSAPSIPRWWGRHAARAMTP